MILVVDIEVEGDPALTDEALLSRKERVIRTLVYAIRRGIAAILNVKEKDIGIVGFECDFGEAVPKPSLGPLEN